MADHAAFLRAILAAPDDDLPRLVYADWLDERGDPRGEFIRVQLAIAGLADEPRCATGLYGTGPPTARDDRDVGRLADLRGREFRLLRDNVSAWVAPLDPMVTGIRFWRGLVDTVCSHALMFFMDSGRWAESMAVRRLRLYGIASGADEVCVHGTVGDAAPRAVLQSPHLTGLTTLAAGGRARLSREVAYAMRRRFGRGW